MKEPRCAKVNTIRLSPLRKRIEKVRGRDLESEIEERLEMTKIALVAWEEVYFGIQPEEGEIKLLQTRQLYTEVGWNFLELEEPVALEEMEHAGPVGQELESLRVKLTQLTLTESKGTNNSKEQN